jgi:hypothetical protein
MADKDFRVKQGIVVGGDAFISNSITSVNAISFETNGFSGGKLSWNTSDGTLDIESGYGDVVLQVGQETQYIVRNSSNSSILNGTSVFCNGVTEGSGRFAVSPMIGDGSISPVQYLGLATQNIASGVNGVVTYFGYVRGLDTRGTSNSAMSVGDETWAVGDKLYVHPTVAGKLTKVEPEAPNSKICVAVVTARHQSTGAVFVRPTTNLTVDKLSDVQLNSLVDGQSLVWVAANSRFENLTVTGDVANLYNTYTTLTANDYNSFTTLTANIYNTFAYLNANVGGGGDASNAWVNANDYATYTTLVGFINTVQDNVYAIGGGELISDQFIVSSSNIFTLSQSATSANNILVSLNGIVQRPADDYIVAGTTLTLANIEPLASGIAVEVRHLSAGSSGGGGDESNLYNTYTTLAANDFNSFTTLTANTYNTLLDTRANDYNTYTTLTANIYNTFAYLNANVGGGGGGGITTGKAIAMAMIFGG